MNGLGARSLRPVASRRPRRFNIPDLSGLDERLTANLSVSLSIGRGFPPGDAQHLVTGFIRTTEGALRRYEQARVRLQRSADEDSLVGYWRGLDDMELTFVALNRAMRFAEALKTSHETDVGKGDLPRGAERDQLRVIRNAINHNVQPILDHHAGVGHTLVLRIGEDDMTIDTIERDSGAVTTHQVAHADMARWLRKLHELAVDLINNPDRRSGAEPGAPD